MNDTHKDTAADAAAEELAALDFNFAAELDSDSDDFEPLSQEAQVAAAMAARLATVLGNKEDGAPIWHDLTLGIDGSTIELLPEQVSALRGIVAQLSAGQNRLYLEAPTGWGKTVALLKLAELIMKSQGEAPLRIAVLVDDTTGLRQWQGAIEEHKPVLGKDGEPLEDCIGAYYGDEKSFEGKSLVVGTYTSFVKARQQGVFGPSTFDLVVLDEGHRSLSELRREILDGIHAVQIALSATPSYSREKSLERHFTCAYRCTSQRAEELGIIAPYRNVIIMQPRVALDNDVINEAGDYNESELRKRFKAAHLTQSFLGFYQDWVFEEKQRTLFGRQGIINCLSVQHADEVAAEVTDALKDKVPEGIIPAVALNGKTPKEYRIWAEKAYRRGEILMLCGDELFVHGFDAPNVDFVFNMAPSTSGVKVGQRGGRARRIDRTSLNPDKIAVIADVLYTNTSPRGWQLLYGEWNRSRLLPTLAPDFTNIKPAEDKDVALQPAAPKKLAVNWDKVGEDQIIDTISDLDQLMLWRERRYYDLRPAPVWSSRFDKMWAEMKRKRVYTVKALQDSMSEEMRQGRLNLILRGTVRHYDPDRYEKGWHPACLEAAQVLGEHVSHLFPVPDEFKRNYRPSRDAHRRLALRRRIKARMDEVGFTTYAELNAFVGIGPTGLTNVINKGSGNLLRNGSWSDVSQRVAGALMTTPEELFGLPAKVKTKLPFEADELAAPVPNTAIARLDAVDLSGVVRRALLALTPREQRVLQLSYGIACEEHTLAEIGEIFEVSGGRAQQLARKAEARLRHRAHADKLRKTLGLDKTPQ
jgi:superfamily II DNA or RNA helicase